jgi:signal transduction histidine kinase/CheY-like chemotaxis protein
MLLIALAPAVLTAGLLVLYFSSKDLERLQIEAENQVDYAVRHLAAVAQYSLVSGNTDLLTRLVQSERRDNNLDWAVIIRPDGKISARAGVSLEPLVDFGQLRGGGRLRTDTMIWASEPITLLSTEVDGLYYEQPQRRGEILGYAVAGFDIEKLSSYRARTFASAASLMFIALLLTGLVAWRLSGRLAARLQGLSSAVDRLSGGELLVRVPEFEDGPHELHLLETGINRMAETIYHHQSELEGRIREATYSLAAQKEAAVQANVAKSRFLAAASHDLRQPLHALVLLTDALKTRNKATELRPLIDNIDASAQAMTVLFNSLLDISRLDAGTIEARPEHFPLERILEPLRSHFWPSAEQKNLRFAVRHCDQVVYSDPILLERILMNLVSNALRYTESGGLLVGCRRRGRQLRIQVWDTGRGIPGNQHETVFQEFVQLDNPERDRNKGLGLGLAIVARLGRLLDHRVDLRSRVARGSVFWIDVPLGDAARVASQPAVGETLSPPTDALTLLVDDEEAVRRGMEELFDSWGMDLLAARDLESALAMLSELGRRPALLISDYRLPGPFNGIQVAAAVRRRFGQQLPVLILTGDTAPDTIQAISRAGVAVLHKPLRPARLRSILSHLLGQGKTGNVA